MQIHIPKCQQKPKCFKQKQARPKPRTAGKDIAFLTALFLPFSLFSEVLPFPRTTQSTEQQPAQEHG